MYNAGITADKLIESVESEVDISPDISRETWMRAINAVEQFVYTEILREYIAIRFSYGMIEGDIIPLSSLVVPEGAADINYDDVIRIFSDGHEVARTGVIGAVEFPEKQLYYTDFSGNIVLSLAEYPDEIAIIVRLRPKLKTTGDEYVALPPEFVDMAAAKMRGEAYKIANEDILAAKWLADYNAQLENFKVWAMTRNERFGG